MDTRNGVRGGKGKKSVEKPIFPPKKKGARELLRRKNRGEKKKRGGVTRKNTQDDRLRGELGRRTKISTGIKKKKPGSHSTHKACDETDGE